MCACAANWARSATIPTATSISTSRTTSACIAGVIWRTAAPRIKLKLEAGLEVVVTGRITTYPGRRNTRSSIETLEPAGPRRADGAGRGAQEEARRRGPVRRRAQAAAAVPAGGDRRHHLADRRGDPRHPASARRPLSAPRAGLAGEGAGRRLGRARSRPRSAASMRCRRRGRSRGPTSSSSRAAAARSKTCGRSTRRSWCAPRPRA